MRDWKVYFEKSERNAEILKFQKPDIVQKINEKIRDVKEKERERIEREKNWRMVLLWRKWNILLEWGW